jgi:hypothetical protein
MKIITNTPNSKELHGKTLVLIQQRGKEPLDNVDKNEKVLKINVDKFLCVFQNLLLFSYFWIKLSVPIQTKHFS